MRFAAWPAAYLLLLVPGIVALFAYAFRRRRLALAEFVTGELAQRVLPPTGEPARLAAGALSRRRRRVPGGRADAAPMGSRAARNCRCAGAT